jgi:hypothetical protein
MYTELPIKLQSNFLTVDGRKLRSDVLAIGDTQKLGTSAEDLQWILSSRNLGRSAILSGIEAIYEQTKQKNPNSKIVRPSVWTMHLAKEKHTHKDTNFVFTQKGYDNGGIRTDRDEILDRFHGHWDAVKNAGFIPEVRKISAAKDAGAWLLLRKPSIEEVAKQWFGHVETREMVIARATPELDKSSIRLYEELGQESVDELEIDGRSDMRMGLNLAVAALKRTMGNIDGFIVDVEDTLEQADNNLYRNESAVLAIQNSFYTS